MSFRKQVILDVGGFDEQFRGNAMREETDFSLRVVRGGWRIVYEPNAELTHLALGGGGSRTADRLNWYRDFFFNESYFFLKHFPKAYLPLLLLRKARAMAACWLYYGRGQWPWFVAPWRAFAQAWKLAHTAE
jgi:GT2 family glycosyltransferase